MACYTEDDVARLLANPGIVRNRLKVRGAIRTAVAVQEIQVRHGSLDAFLWNFVDGRTRLNRWTSMRQVPTAPPEAQGMSKALAKVGATFVGPTICYAFMQAAGLVDDHLLSCWKRSPEMRPTFDG